MMLWVVVMIGLLAIGVGLAFLVAMVISINRAYRNSRESAFRRTLRGYGYTEAEICKAIEEQGW